MMRVYEYNRLNRIQIKFNQMLREFQFLDGRISHTSSHTLYSRFYFHINKQFNDVRLIKRSKFRRVLTYIWRSGPGEGEEDKYVSSKLNQFNSVSQNLSVRDWVKLWLWVFGVSRFYFSYTNEQTNKQINLKKQSLRIDNLLITFKRDPNDSIKRFIIWTN